MRVGVVGAGAIGGLYGGVLARAGNQVGFLARGEHLRAIQSRGLKVESPTFGSFAVQAPASDNPAELGEAELVLLTVKTYDLDEAVVAAQQMLSGEGAVMTFQNGLEAPGQVAARVGEQHVLVGTTGLEATILEPGVVGHLADWHYVTVSALNGPPSARVEHIAQTLRAAGINASVVPDGHRALWEKAMILMPMATITSVCRAPIGQIRDLPATRELALTLLEEVSAVARACGYELPAAHERARSTIETAPASMKASMARDFERGKRTELEALTGALVRLADAQRIEVPAMRTAYAILKLRERLESGEASGKKPLGIGADGR
jgi:2-dehydropantoate 2-reductase